MYRDFYKLKEDPFNITADPEYFFLSHQHSEAFSHLMYGIKERKGIMVVTGEIGTGKTTLCRTLLNHLDPTTKTALILNPSFSDVQLLRIILKDLGINGEFRNKNALIQALNEFLLSESSKGHNVVIIIDEAQNLKIRELEQVRLLSNLETEKDKLLQIVLVGQPELCDTLKLQSMRQLNQRISVRYHLQPLNVAEVEGYINHRLDVARTRQTPPNPLFTNEAITEIFKLSNGTPRMVNMLCDRALLAGFVNETNRINEQIVRQSAEELL